MSMINIQIGQELSEYKPVETVGHEVAEAGSLFVPESRQFRFSENDTM